MSKQNAKSVSIATSNPQAPHRDVTEEFNNQGEEFLKDLAASIFDIEGDILDLTDVNASASQTEKLARYVHSIKGTAIGYGFDLIGSICHNFEDRIIGLRMDSKDVEPQIDGLLRHVDFLRGAVIAYRNRDFDLVTQLRLRLREQVAATRSGASSISAPGRHLRVLVIEKMGALLLLMNQALKRYDSSGIEIAVARDGYEGFGRLLKEKFDCILMSNRSEVLKGTELVTLLSSVDSPNQKTPFILLTSDESLPLPKSNSPVHVVPKGDDLRGNLVKHLTALFGEPRRSQNFEKYSYKDILLVDDSIVIHRLVEMALKGVPDLNLRFASGGSDALIEVGDRRPDLVLLDYQMPGMDGIELANRLRKDFPGLPYVFLTAADSDSDQAKLRAVQPLAILKKPFPPRDLPLWLATLPKAA